MSTKYLVDKLFNRIRVMKTKIEWTRSTGSLSILKLLEAGQDALLNKVKQSQIWKGPENRGFPPYLVTVSGTTRYDIIAANLANVPEISIPINGITQAVRAKQVQKVFVDASKTGYSTSLVVGVPAFNISPSPYAATGGRTCLAQIGVEQHGALENTPAYIVFMSDPGSTNNQYFVEFTWEAPRLIDFTVPLVISTDFEPALEEFAMGIVQQYENPQASNVFMNTFDTYWIPKFSKELCSGAKVNNNQVTPRLC